MDEYNKIQAAIDSVIESLSANEYAVRTIKDQQRILSHLLNFMKEKNYTIFNEQVGIEYIYYRTNYKVKGFWGYYNRRVSDIRSLELSSLNWSRKTINLIVQKTKKAIELPLLDDIGWAIIDYLKNGRPKTICTRVFVRHRAPYDAVGENECFHKELHRYMQSAGIIPPVGMPCGLHSLRSTLARKMLESGTPLPVISETLGHSNINTTSLYLKIDLEGLKKCTLDPEEVFS